MLCNELYLLSWAIGKRERAADEIILNINNNDSANWTYDLQ